MINGQNGFFLTGEGRPIVLLHSSMSDKNQWRMLAHQLNPSFKIISIDLAGYGDNPPPENRLDFSTRDEVRIIKKALSATLDENEPFHLAGHSYGGAIALKLAYELQHRILSLTVFEPVAFHLLPEKNAAALEIRGIVKQLEKHADKKDPEAATRIFLDYWSGKGTFERLSRKNKNRFMTFAEKIILDFQALFNESLTLDDYSEITVPVCLIKGTQSPLPPLEICRILAAALPNIEVHRIRGGHMAPITNFDAVNTIIEDFILKTDLRLKQNLLHHLP